MSLPNTIPSVEGAEGQGLKRQLAGTLSGLISKLNMGKTTGRVMAVKHRKMRAPGRAEICLMTKLSFHWLPAYQNR